MANTASTEQRAVLLEIGGADWQTMVSRVEPWLSTTARLQAAFRQACEVATGSAREPHLREYLSEVAGTASRHEATVSQLYGAFGVDRDSGRGTLLGTGLAGVRMLAGQLVARLAGARGPTWAAIRVLMRSNLDSIGAFAVTEQLGLSLGVPAVVDLVVPVLKEKQTHQLLLQEYLLETATNAVLYHRGT